MYRKLIMMTFLIIGVVGIYTSALGKEITATGYYCVYETEIAGTQTVTLTVSGKSYTLKASFLYGGRGAAMQGTGRTGPGGDYIHYDGGSGTPVPITDEIRRRYAKIGITDFTGFYGMALAFPDKARYSVASGVIGAANRILKPWYSIAVDIYQPVLPLNSTGTLCFKNGTTPEGEESMDYSVDDKGHSNLYSPDWIDVYLGEGDAAYQTWLNTGGDRPVSLECLAGLDLIFVIDTTGSMWDDIANVKAAATEIVNTIDSEIDDYRVAVVDYRDFSTYPYGGSGDYPYHVMLPFSTDKTSVIGAIQGLSIGWGADWPESVYSALTRAIYTEGLGPWRDGVKKAIILMGDAPPP